MKFRNIERIVEEFTLSEARLRNGSNYPILIFDDCGEFNFYTLEGKWHINSECDLDLIMFEEIEVKEPRVIWVNIYPNNAIFAHNSKEDAFKDLMPSGKAVKFIEVIEEGE